MSSRTSARRRAGLLASGVVACLAWQAGVRTQEAPRVDDLASLWSVGGLIADRNGDGVADESAAAFVLGETPTDAEVAAAAEIAARLGFETSALTLPLRREPEGVVVAVGQGAIARLKIDVRPLELPRLAAGQGLVRVATLDGTRFVFVLGGDAAGLRAAARTLAARVPFLWPLGGATYAQVERDVEQLLTTAKVTGATVDVPELHVKAGAEGLDGVVVVVRLSSLRDMTAAMFALQRVQMDRDRAAGSTRTAALSYPGVQNVSIRLGGPDSPSVNIDVPRATSTVTKADSVTERAVFRGSSALDLSNLYTGDGLLVDADGNHMPDGTRASLAPVGEGVERTVDLAARLGLESTGLTIPLLSSDASAHAKDGTTPVLIGTSHPLMDRLVEAGKLERPALAPGEGLVHVVPRAFGDQPALVVTGGDAAGVDRALSQVAERLPHVWSIGIDRTTLEDIEHDVRRFIGARSPAGQAVSALRRTRQLLSRLGDAKPTAVEVVAALEAPDPKLAAYLEAQVEAAVSGARVTTSVQGLDVRSGTPLAVDGRTVGADTTIPSEVAELRQVFAAKMLKAAKKGKPFRLDARISEPAAVRRAVADDFKAQLAKKGLRDADISIAIRPAHKQAYWWLVDDILPALEGKNVAAVEIAFAEGPGDSAAARTSAHWLASLVPADEAIAEKLGLPLAKVTLSRMAGEGKTTHRVVAKTAGGETVLEQSFAAAHTTRPRLNRYPDYERTPVETGWVTATSDRKVLADQRVATDIERAWDAFQERALEPMHDYAVGLDDGQTRPAHLPLFGTMRVEVSLSEPDELLHGGERSAPLESLRAEIVTGTRRFFERVGEAAGYHPNAALGSIVPVARATSDGVAGKLAVTATGFEAPRPMVSVRATFGDGTTALLRSNISAIEIERPSATALSVRAGQPGLARLDVRLKVDSPDDGPSDTGTSRDGMLSASAVADAIADLGALRGAGLYKTSLAYQDLGELRLHAAWTYDGRASDERLVTLEPNGEPAGHPMLANVAAGRSSATRDGPGDHTAAGVLRHMAELTGAHRHARAFAVGRSVEGREVWALELVSGVDATHISRAKASTFKPTALFAAGARGSDVASTAQLLRLADSLVTDPQRSRLLETVNVVLVPRLNPDGAALAAELADGTAPSIPFATATGALGQDVERLSWDEDPPAPESAATTRAWRVWRPDVVVTGTAEPAHLVWPVFSPVGSTLASLGSTTAADGGLLRSFRYLDDEHFPWHKAAALALHERITERLARDDRAVARAERRRVRETRMAAALSGLAANPGEAHALVAAPTRGPRASGSASDPAVRHPETTYWSGTFVTASEGGSDEILDEAITVGVTLDFAVLDELASRARAIERRDRVTSQGVWLQWHRDRPGLARSTTGGAPTTAASRTR